jgi:hypothetical protein
MLDPRVHKHHPLLAILPVVLIFTACTQNTEPRTASQSTPAAPAEIAPQAMQREQGALHDAHTAAPSARVSPLIPKSRDRLEHFAQQLPSIEP